VFPWALVVSAASVGIAKGVDGLSAIDHKLLALRQGHRVLTTPQLISLTARPERTIDYRLSRLRGSGFVDRTRPYAESGSSPFYWWLTRRGAGVIEGSSPAPGKGSPNPLFLRHTAAIGGIYVGLVDVGPHVGLTEPTWRRDELAWEEWVATMGGVKHLRPDAHLEVSLEVDGASERAGAFIEVDFATMDQKRLAAKVGRHRKYCEDRVWWDRHRGCPALLLVTTSDVRVTRFLSNIERTTPRSSPYGEIDPLSWKPLVAACACVMSPEEALTAPVWRTSVADAPSTLTSLLAGEVRKYRHFIAGVRTAQTAEKRSRDVRAIRPLMADRDLLAETMGDPEASAGVVHIFNEVLPYNAERQEEWAAGHLPLVRATHDWWVVRDGRLGWPPPPAAVVAEWRTLYLTLWADQATELLELAAQSVDCPKLRRPAATLAAGEFVKSWQLSTVVAMDGPAEAARATAYYLDCRDRAVTETVRALPLHRRITVARDTIESDYDDAHLVVCVDCGITRHDDLGSARQGRTESCPLCGGALVPAHLSPALAPTLAESVAAISERLDRDRNAPR
jgi:hypothetical protein